MINICLNCYSSNYQRKTSARRMASGLPN